MRQSSIAREGRAVGRAMGRAIGRAIGRQRGRTKWAWRKVVQNKCVLVGVEKKP
jgi:hypothetical protein